MLTFLDALEGPELLHVHSILPYPGTLGPAIVHNSDTPGTQKTRRV